METIDDNVYQRDDIIEVLKDVDLREVAVTKSKSSDGREDTEDSFFVCDLGKVIEQYEKWMKHFPRVWPHYAMKTCPQRAVIVALNCAGAGLDCASKEEIKLALNLGFHPDKIVYSNTTKQRSHVQYAKEKDVSLMVFDDEGELEKIKTIYPEARLLMRISAGDDSSSLKISEKFGAREDKCKSMLLTAQKMNLKVVGISFHIGGGYDNICIHRKALEISKRLFIFAEEMGIKFHVLNIGGGFSDMEGYKFPFVKVAKQVSDVLDELFPPNDYPDLRIMAEPGRYMVASSVVQATNIIGKKKKDITEVTSTSPNQYIINDGIHGSMYLIDHGVDREFLPSALQITETEIYPSHLYGPTSSGIDNFKKEYELPNLEEGDWFLWKNMGAYTICLRTEFNGFITRAIYKVISKEKLNFLRAISKGKVDEYLTFEE